jgi:O-antigen ligase
MIALVIPWIIPLGGVNFPIYRIVLLSMLVPCLAHLLQKKAGTVRAADIGVFAYCIWIGIALTTTQGFAKALQPSSSFFIDGFGAYLLGRCYIRSAEDFGQMVSFAVKLLATLLPFALYEWMTGKTILLTMFGAVFPTVEFADMPPRLGLFRVQGPFSHPILFGVFCGSIFALVCSVPSSTGFAFGRGFSACIVAVSAMLSMSSAPLAGVAFQAALLIWCKALSRFSWNLNVLWALVLTGYLIVEFGSNQTPIQFYISHFTFDTQTGWYRLLIWDFGSASVMNHPLFGIGLDDWVRPPWMASKSVDNFWLLTAMRYGVPALIIISMSCLVLWISLARKRTLPAALKPYRQAYLICMVTFVFVGSTVHFWASLYSWFFFLLACGVWLLDINREASSEAVRMPSRKVRIPPTL